ncbi:MAG: hypothetical protein H8E55_22300 [Pelagibacterales bacterium]|nr:hypothetical protein [Pelagibacterales bacterium]
MPRKKKEKSNEPKPPPKKRGRKPKKKDLEDDIPKIPKKRGRKPKGGKIIKKENLKQKTDKNIQHNIILHLKCPLTTEDNNNIIIPTDYNPVVNKIASYNINTNSKLSNLQFQDFKTDIITQNEELNKKWLDKEETKTDDSNEDINMKQIWIKLEILKKKLRTNDVSDRKSACFWCTCNFDNPSIHIPMKYENECYEVYGCFCSPECAVAYLKQENIDTSTLWERYSLLNNIYSRIYDYKKNIKPSPSPFFTLDKYYGNLSIQEYRKLLNNDRLLLVVNKPMTKILPELYEENNEIPMVYSNLLNKNIDNKNKDFRLKRKTTNVSKTQILSSNFQFN